MSISKVEKEILVEGLKTKGFKEVFKTELSEDGFGYTSYLIWSDGKHMNLFSSNFIEGCGEEEDGEKDIYHYFCQKGDRKCIHRIFKNEDLESPNVINKEPVVQLTKWLKKWGDIPLTPTEIKQTLNMMISKLDKPDGVDIDYWDILKYLKDIRDNIDQAYKQEPQLVKKVMSRNVKKKIKLQCFDCKHYNFERCSHQNAPQSIKYRGAIKSFGQLIEDQKIQYYYNHPFDCPLF